MNFPEFYIFCTLEGCRNFFCTIKQTMWQRQFLRREGNETCLLDVTYRTTRYSLSSVFSLCTYYINYMTVGTFIVESEDTPSIQQALSFLKRREFRLDTSIFYVRLSY